MQQNEQPRQMNRWLAMLITAVAGIGGGIVGILTPFWWGYLASAIFGMSRIGAAIDLTALFTAPITGAFGAMVGGWAASHYIDWFERRPGWPKFRDKRAGGIITFVVKVFIGLIVLLVIGVSVFMMQQR